MAGGDEKAGHSAVKSVTQTYTSSAEFFEDSNGKRSRAEIIAHSASLRIEPKKWDVLRRYQGHKRVEQRAKEAEAPLAATKSIFEKTDTVMNNPDTTVIDAPARQRVRRIIKTLTRENYEAFKEIGGEQEAEPEAVKEPATPGVSDGK